MKILILNPPRVDNFPVVREERYEHKDVGSVYPPLSLLYTVAFLEKAEYKPILIDANGFDIPENEVYSEIDKIKPDVIITRCGFDTQKEDLKFLKYAKEKFNSITILRNKIIGDVDWLKKDLLLKNKFIDIFLNYEPDSIIVSLIKHIEKFGKDNLENVDGISFIKDNELITTKPAKIIENLDELPFPAYHLLKDLSVYHTGVLNPPFATVITSRGCPFGCSFCAYARMGFRVRSPENIVQELKWLKSEFKIKSFLFFDDLVGLKKEHFENVCKLMIEANLNLKWSACTRANLLTDEMVKLMKKAGCIEIPIGIESGSEKILKLLNKGITLDDIRRAAKILHKNKMLFYGMVIIGLPGETKETIKETLKFIKEIDPFYTQFCFATPFPNTEIYKYYKERNLLLTEDWSKYTPISNYPVIRTEELTAEDLINLRNYVYRKLVLRPLYLLKKIKIFDWRWNIEGFIKILGVIWRILKRKAVR